MNINTICYRTRSNYKNINKQREKEQKERIRGG